MANEGEGCNCRKEIEAKLLERFKTKCPDASGYKVELQGYGFAIVDNALVMRPYMPYQLGAEFPLKKGGSKWKKETGSFVFNFCPFCGEQIA